MILDDIVARKKLQLIENPLSIALLENKASKMPPVKDFYKALEGENLSIIAEVKKASPSKGIIAKDFDFVKIALEYEKGGANAISVLTEKHFFMGDNEYLTAIKEKVTLPILRKDFIIDEKQVLETLAIGADAILLIAAILDEKTMKRLFSVAKEYSLHCLFEARNKDELLKIISCGAEIIGINNRDLNTFAVDLHTFESLSPIVPNNCLAVAESGIFDREDAKRMKNAGANAILVGEALMRSENIEKAINQLKIKN